MLYHLIFTQSAVYQGGELPVFDHACNKVLAIQKAKPVLRYSSKPMTNNHACMQLDKSCTYISLVGTELVELMISAVRGPIHHWTLHGHFC